MAKQRPFRFGTGGYQAKSRDELITLTRKIEDLGYTVFAMPDHFEPILAPFTTLMTVANITSTLRLSCTVFANDFRHPAVLRRKARRLTCSPKGAVNWAWVLAISSRIML